nr:transient receptor potential cation channel subfamily M member-like 2 [Hydra vulgaris]
MADTFKNKPEIFIKEFESGIQLPYEQKNTMLRNNRILPTETQHNFNKSINLDVKNMGLKRRKESSVSGTGFTVNVNINQKKTNISRHFTQKECFKYIEVIGGLGEKLCGCGLPRSKHVSDCIVINQPNIKWTKELCTRRVPTDSYGEIEFIEQRGSRKPYIRISDDTSGLTLLSLLKHKWALDVPNLVISVTGGAKSFHLRPKLKDAFTKGIVKIAHSTGSWIITGGTNAGVMKHVGEAIKNRGNVSNAGRSKINVIGIAPWGVVANNHLLVSKDGGLAEYTHESSDSSKTGLDFNHSHFILVDNGTSGQYGTEIELRSQLEGAIAKHLKTNSNAASGTIGIPVVILCLEGGPNTIKTMVEGVRKGTPAVVIDGSGRAADVVCYAYKHLTFDKVIKSTIINPQYIDDIKQKISEVFGQNSKESVYKEIEELLKDEKMITVFRMDDESGQCDMDLAILRALLKANKASFEMQLKLALAWNRIDVAKSEIFTEDLKQDHFKVEWLYESMFTALSDNKPDFVELFFEEGLNLKFYLKMNELLNLYNGVPNGTALRHLMKKYMGDATEIYDMIVIGSVIENLMGDHFRSRYSTDYPYCQSNYEKSSEMHLLKNTSNKDLPSPYLDLFTWAVLLNRKELAYLIWKRTRDSIATALMASKLLKSLAEKVQDNKELSDMVEDIIQHAVFYENLAVGVLEECRKDNEEEAQTLLVKEIPEFGFLSCLDIAVSANNQDFIAHSSCQTLLSRLWMGALYINTSLWKVLPCIFFPFLINIIIWFREDMENKSIDMHRKSVISYDNTAKEVHTDALNDLNNLNQSKCSLQKSFYSATKEDIFSDEKKVLHDFDDEPEAFSAHEKHGFFLKMIHFYNAPFVKFIVNLISYASFLALFAFVILLHFRIEIHNSEYVLQFWAFTLLCEEIHQLIIGESDTFYGKMTIYCSNPWNTFEILALNGFLLGTIYRYLANKYLNFNYLIIARIIYAFDIMIFIIRMLKIYSVNRNMGPKLVMIRKMLRDLSYFLMIFAVFLIGFGVAQQVLLHPNSQPYKAFVGIFNHPYWYIYGQLNFDEIFGDNSTCNGEGPACYQHDADDYVFYILPLCLAVYLIFTNILLLNLLIAIFNYTFSKIIEDSDKVWKFQRFDLILEFHNRPAFCPPFIIISHLYLLIKWFLKICFNPSAAKSSSMRIHLFPEEMEQLLLWEHTAAEAFCYKTTIKEAETQDERVKNILNRVNLLAEKVDLQRNDFKESFMHEHNSKDISESVELRLSKVEQNMEKILELLIQQKENHGVVSDANENNNSHHSVQSLITNIHTKSRLSPYPGSTIHRFKVPDDLVSWKTAFPEYSPVLYTSPVVLKQPYWADIDLMTLNPRPNLCFNTYDEQAQVNRVSHCGLYEIIDGLPRNPYGRTGIVGRGILGRFGPNHAADPIATRWKRNSSGILLDNGKKVLEFIAIQRRDNQQWAIPGGMVEPGEKISETLRKEFAEEALAKLEMSEDKQKEISDKITFLFRNGIEVYKGYVDDPRNTDNAWMETVAYNFHDDTGEVFGELQLHAGDDAQAVRWQRVSGNIPLFASHVGILQKVASIHSAAFN